MSSTPFQDLIKQAAEAKFVVVPAQDYLVVCRDAKDTKSSTAKDMIKLTVKIIAGPHKGASVPTQQTLTPDNPVAVAMFIKFLDAFGIDEDFLAALPPRADGGPDMAAVARALKGRAAVASVGVGEWQGEDRNEVERFKKPSAEQAAQIKEALAADGVEGNPMAPPSASADPFAASAAPAADGKAPF